LKNITVAVDAMGGDHGLKVIIPASLRAVKKNPDLKLLLVGNESQIHAQLKKSSLSSAHANQISVIHASEVVAMDELPSPGHAK